MITAESIIAVHTQVLAGGNGLGTTGPIIGGIINIILAVVCFSIAKSRGRGPILWGILGLIFNFIALIVLVIIPRKR